MPVADPDDGTGDATVPAGESGTGNPAVAVVAPHDDGYTAAPGAGVAAAAVSSSSGQPPPSGGSESAGEALSPPAPGSASGVGPCAEEEATRKMGASVEAVAEAAMAEGVLDEQFKQLLALQDEDNPDFLGEVIRLFLQDAKDKFTKLRESLAKNDPQFEEMDGLVHQFKGSSSSVGTPMVSNLCIQFREHCVNKDAHKCRDALAQLISAHLRAEKTLQEILSILEAK